MNIEIDLINDISHEIEDCAGAQFIIPAKLRNQEYDSPAVRGWFMDKITGLETKLITEFAVSNENLFENGKYYFIYNINKGIPVLKTRDVKSLYQMFCNWKQISTRVADPDPCRVLHFANEYGFRIEDKIYDNSLTSFMENHFIGNFKLYGKYYSTEKQKAIKTYRKKYQIPASQNDDEVFNEFLNTTTEIDFYFYKIAPKIFHYTIKDYLK